MPIKPHIFILILLMSEILPACGITGKASNPNNQTRLIHFARYQSPPNAPPIASVTNIYQHPINGLIYEYNWSGSTKRPTNPITWPVVVINSHTKTIVFTFNTQIEPGTAFLQVFNSINKSGYPNSPRPNSFCNTSQGNPNPTCEISKSSSGYAEVLLHLIHDQLKRPKFYISLFAQWPKLIDKKLEFYRCEWLLAIQTKE